jgi:hypothetical protein
MPGMNIDGPSLLLSLALGAVGFVLTVYGKRMGRLPHLMAGLVLMIFPYFAPSILITLVIALVALGGLGFAVRSGL